MESGAQPGNTNSQRPRVVYKALMRAVAQSDGEQIRSGVERILELFGQGDRWAAEFVRDTLDGKPKQQTEISGPDGEPIPVKGVVEFVRSPAPAPGET
jgi:hypothetical protein